jgi:hypothetical protein
MIRAKNQNGVTRKLVHVHVSICAIPFLLSRGVKGYTILVLSLLMKGLTTTLYNTRGSLRSLGDSAQFG